MDIYLISIIGILLPFFGTSLGSSFVFLIKNKINNNLEKLMIGFSSGVMISSSIFSLIIPSLKLSNYLYIQTIIGIIIGIIFLVLIDALTKNIDMISLSVTLHNIPEGMAVGVVFAGVLALSNSISIEESLMLSIGIAIQNIPEGSIISVPCKLKGKSKLTSFLYGVYSGLVEPISALITILLISYIFKFMSIVLSFAAGAMIYVAIELILEIIKQKSYKYGLSGIFLGLLIMSLLDIYFG